MIRQVWLNLPVKDIRRSREFFSAIGFTANDRQSNETMLAIKSGDNGSPVMLFEEKEFAKVIHAEISDTSRGSELMISFDAETREEINETAEKVRAAGGVVFSAPADIQGWMYGFAFTDPDGHRWNQLYMDKEKMPKM